MQIMAMRLWECKIGINVHINVHRCLMALNVYHKRTQEFIFQVARHLCSFFEIISLQRLIMLINLRQGFEMANLLIIQVLSMPTPHTHLAPCCVFCQSFLASRNLLEVPPGRTAVGGP